MYISNSRSKSIEIAEKLKSFFNIRVIEKINNKQQFYNKLRDLNKNGHISDPEYAYCIANFYRIILDLRLYHLFITNAKDNVSGLFQFWLDVTDELVRINVQKKDFTSMKKEILAKYEDIEQKHTLKSEQEEKLSPFAKALNNIEYLYNSDQKSFEHFQESLQACQKILFELREILSLSGIVSPVLYDIVKVARELPRHYTNKDDLLKDLKELINLWRKRLKKNNSILDKKTMK
ncbi:MAG: hypothetical protein HeimC3_02930 [Candidatus Heimdallarchaeota archaeon LC_3]|nr:MAG: hypothetical protein HeimC3_02930 [Candidatus Heimdallarchaeota archaeon LC_3]